MIRKKKQRMHWGKVYHSLLRCVGADSVLQVFSFSDFIYDRVFKSHEVHRRIFNFLSAMVWYKDSDGKILLCNKLAADFLGKTPEDIEGYSFNTFFPDADLTLLVDDREVISSRQPVLETVGKITLPGKNERWLRVDKIPCADAKGDIQNIIIFALDITESKKAEDNLKFLNQATRLFSDSNDFRITLKQVACFAVPYFADLCVVDLIESGSFRREAIAASDPKLENLVEIFKKHPPVVGSPHPAWEVLKSRKGLLLDNVKDDHPDITVDPVKLGMDQELVDAVQKLGPTQSILVPLLFRQEVIGILYFISNKKERKYTEMDLILAKELSSRAAAAIENARLHKDSQSAIRAREEFLSVASHELKTPLTSLTLQVQLATKLLKAESSHFPHKEQILYMLSRANKELHQQARMIENLLNLTRLQTGNLTLETESLDLCTLIRDVVSRFDYAAKEGKSLIQLNLPSSLSGIWDRLRLEQVFTNLFSNAFKYAGRAPIEITVQLLKEINGRDLVRILFKDYGPGIPVERQARIFGRYERATLTKGGQSLGLGLYITKQIICAHNGKISLISDPGQGCVFAIEIPRYYVENALPLEDPLRKAQ